MTKYIVPYVVALLALGVLNLVWLTLTKSFYTAQIGHLFAAKITWWAVVAFYLLYAGAVVYFAVLGTVSPMQAMVAGALLGFTAYMTYDLVNLATLAGWPLRFALVDVAWGAVITAAAAYVARITM